MGNTFSCLCPVSLQASPGGFLYTQFNSLWPCLAVAGTATQTATQYEYVISKNAYIVKSILFFTFGQKVRIFRIYLKKNEKKRELLKSPHSELILL